jgi:hypothetical protein
MFSFTSQSRKSGAILAAGAAALLLTGLGTSNAVATQLNWDPGLTHGTNGSNGAGTWNTTNANWSNGTADVAWNSADLAGFIAPGSGSYTVSVANGITADGLVVGSSTALNNYTFQSAGTGSYTLTESGRLSVNGGSLTLQNITIDNSAYSGAATDAISDVYDNGVLNIGTGGYVKGGYIAAGEGAAPGVINVNSGGTLSESARIQINFGNGLASGNELNVNGGTVKMSGGILWLTDSNLAGGMGEMNVGADTTGGTVTVSQFNTGGGGTGQTGILNLDSGTVSATSGSASITSDSGQTTEVNVNGATLTSATLNAKQITSGSGTNLGTTNLTITGGTVSATNSSASITSGSGSTTDVNISGGALNTGQITAGGTTNLTISGGTVNATDGSGSISSGGSGTATNINLNGGVLSVVNIENGSSGGTTPTFGSVTLTFNGGTLQENGGSAFNRGIMFANSGGGTTDAVVNGGGATIDTNGSAGVYVYVPLTAGTGSGGLTVENSQGGAGMVALAGGANTYTGPTVVDSNMTLQLVGHGSPITAATIANSTLQLASGATFNPQPDITAGTTGMNLNLGGLVLTGGSTIELALTSTAAQELTLAGAASISGTNTIDMFPSLSPTSLTPGQYTLISAPSGLTAGAFDFSNGSLTENLTVGSNNYLLSLGTIGTTAETLTVAAVPEPTAVALLAVGAMGLLLIRRRKPAA